MRNNIGGANVHSEFRAVFKRSEQTVSIVPLLVDTAVPFKLRRWQYTYTRASRRLSCFSVLSSSAAISVICCEIFSLPSFSYTVNNDVQYYTCSTRMKIVENANGFGWRSDLSATSLASSRLSTRVSVSKIPVKKTSVRLICSPKGRAKLVSTFATSIGDASVHTHRHMHFVTIILDLLTNYIGQFCGT